MHYSQQHHQFIFRQLHNNELQQHMIEQ